jgi:ABC-type transporter Mla subunit MlaD
MSAKASYFRLGLFVIVGTLLLIVGIIYLGVGEYFEERFQVETYFSDSVQGVSVGTPVKFRGVTVGDVERISFVQDVYEPDDLADRRFGYVRVRFGIGYEFFPGLSPEELRADLARAVQDGARVRLASAGLMGTAFLSLEYLDRDENPALELAWTPKRFYIPSAPSAVGAMIKSMESTLRNLAQVDVKGISTNLNTLLVDADKQINDLQIAGVREKAIALLDELRGTNGKIKELLSKPELEKAIDDAGGAIADIRGLTNESDEDVKAAIANLRSATERVDALLADERIDTIVQGLADTSEQLPPAAASARRTLQGLRNLLQEERRDIEVVIQNLRAISEAFAALSADARDNPSRVLFGNPPPRKKPGE